MALLILVLRIAFWLLVIRLAGRLLAVVVRAAVPGFAGGPPAPAPAPPRRAAVDLVRDPVCNTFVPRASALAVHVGGRVEHYCSPACRDRGQARA